MWNAARARSIAIATTRRGYAWVPVLQVAEFLSIFVLVPALEYCSPKAALLKGCCTCVAVSMFAYQVSGHVLFFTCLPSGRCLVYRGAAGEKMCHLSPRTQKFADVVKYGIYTAGDAHFEFKAAGGGGGLDDNDDYRSSSSRDDYDAADDDGHHSAEDKFSTMRVAALFLLLSFRQYSPRPSTLGAFGSYSSLLRRDILTTR